MSLQKRHIPAPAYNCFFLFYFFKVCDGKVALNKSKSVNFSADGADNAAICRARRISSASPQKSGRKKRRDKIVRKTEVRKRGEEEGVVPVRYCFAAPLPYENSLGSVIGTQPFQQKSPPTKEESPPEAISSILSRINRNRDLRCGSLPVRKRVPMKFVRSKYGKSISLQRVLFPLIFLS